MNNRALGRRSLLALPLVVLALSACAKPEPPRLTAKAVRVVAISNKGVDLDLTISAENPNSVDLDTSAVTGTVTFDDGLEVGKTSTSKSFHLPARKTVELHAPLSLTWKSLPALAPYLLRPSVPYTVKGEVQMEEPISAKIPFTLKGTLTQAELSKLAGSALPAIPGFK